MALQIFRRTERGRSARLAAEALTRFGALQIIKRRARDAELPPEICCHTFRATVPLPT